MIYFIFTFFAIFFIFSFFSRKYNNPYKLLMVFGKKGSGKSTLLVKWMIRDLRRGWHVYTDMSEIALDGINLINAKDLAKWSPPPNSSVYLDEVGITFDNRQYQQFNTGLRDWFKLQRHYKCKVVLASQSFDIDVKLRNLTDKLFLQTNIGNIIGISRPIERTVTLTDANMGESRIADQLKFGKIWSWRFTWLPKYHKYFDSFDAPKRELIPSEVIHGLAAPRGLLRYLRRCWRKS